jgi:hypothetical protein
MSAYIAARCRARILRRDMGVQRGAALGCRSSTEVGVSAHNRREVSLGRTGRRLFGVYLGSCFAPTHKGMPLLSAGDQLDFLRRQVLTSRNVRGGRWIDLGIEHHLFPSMPSPSLRRAQPLIRAFCLGHDLPYAESTPTGSYTQVLRYLHDVGATAHPRNAIHQEKQ